MNPNQIQFDQDTLQRFQAAKAAGIPDEENIREAAKYQASKMQDTIETQQPEQKKSLTDNLLEWLPAAGAIGGSFVPLPGVGTIGGGVAGAGLATLLKQIIQNKPFDTGEVGKEAAFAGIGGAVGEGLGAIGSKVLPKFAKGLGEVGENLAIKELRANPSQLTNFAEKHGVDLAKYIGEKGLQGRLAPELLESQAVAPLQASFDAITKTSGAKVAPNTLLDNFSKIINELKASPSTEDAKIADQIYKEISSIIDKTGNKPIDIGELSKFRQIYDSKVKSWMADPIQAGKNRLVGNALRKTIQDTADAAGLVGPGGESLKAIGLDLSKLYDILDIAKGQGNLGRGSLPVGMTKLLFGGVGGGVGGIPGAIGGMATADVVNNPAVIGALSKFATNAGKGVEKIPGIPESVSGLLGPTGAGIGAAAGGGEDGAQPIEAATTSSKPDLSALGSTTDTTDNSDKVRKVIGAIMMEKAKSVSDIKAAYEFLYPKESDKPLSETQQARKDVVSTAKEAMAALSSKDIKVGPFGIGSKIEEFKGKFNAGDPDTLDFLTKIAQVKASIARSRAGTSFTPNEEKLLNQYTPNIGDSEQEIQTKLSNLIDFYNDR